MTLENITGHRGIFLDLLFKYFYKSVGIVFDTTNDSGFILTISIGLNTIQDFNRKQDVEYRSPSK